jgi:hypothetical protein
MKSGEPKDEKKTAENSGKKTTESLSTPDAEAEKEVTRAE